MKKNNFTRLFASIFFLGLIYMPALHGMRGKKKNESLTFSNYTGMKVVFAYARYKGGPIPSREKLMQDSSKETLSLEASEQIKLKGTFCFYPIKPEVEDSKPLCLGRSEICKIKICDDQKTLKLLVMGTFPFYMSYKLQTDQTSIEATTGTAGDKSES